MARVPVTLRDLFWSDPFFESAWGGGPDGAFAEMRNQMWREHNRMWNLFHDVFGGESAPAEPQAAIEGHGESSSSEVCPWFMPPRSWNIGPGQGNSQVMRIQDDTEKFEVSLDTHEYRPDELKINVKNNVLQVEGQHEEKSEDGKTVVSRKFVRHYTLPEGCQTEKVTSNLSKDGVLMISAPKEAAQPVPITMQKWVVFLCTSR